MSDSSLPRSAAGVRSPWLIAVIVSVATFMELLDVAIVNVSLRHIAGGLKVDYIGFALVVLGFGALQIMLDRYEIDDGFSSDFIVSLGAIGAVSLLILVVWEL